MFLGAIGGFTHAAEPITNSIGMKLVPIAPGSFVMGQDGPTTDYFFTKHPEEMKLADFDERPAHKVTISQAFHLGATEVTVGQYRQFQPKHQKRAAVAEAITTAPSWR